MMKSRIDDSISNTDLGVSISPINFVGFMYNRKLFKSQRVGENIFYTAIELWLCRLCNNGLHNEPM